MEQNKWILCKLHQGMRKKIYLVAVFFGFFIPLAMSAQASPYVTLTVGELFADPSLNQSITFDPSYWKRLIANHTSVSQIYGGISAGLRIPLTSIWEVEVGAGYYQVAGFRQSGKIYQYNRPDFYNLNYDYEIQVQRLMFEGKLLTTFQTIYHPYLAAKIGASRNRSHNYQETPVQTYAVSDPPFADAAQNNFSYSAGFGLDISLTPRWRIGGGYEYSNLGSAKLGRSPVQASSQQVSSGTINASQVLLQLSYQI